MTEVAVVGAGPTGLMLACELALSGVTCTVLERRARPRTDSRAISMHARSLELLDLRGLAGRFTDAGIALPTFPLGLKGAGIDFGRLDSDFPYLLGIPQSRIEELLAERALELGVNLRWSTEVTGISQDGDGVTVTLGDTVERYAYVTACDGIRSFVRRALGVPFPGFANPGSVSLADVHLDGLAMTDSYGDLTDAGMLLVFPFRDGSCRVVLYDYARADVPADEPVTLPEVRDGIRRITGQDLRPRDLRWSGRYRSESRQVPCYRVGRVLFAGDAAHTHSPAGAQGLNTGLQDSFNLGWKLAATLRGDAPGWLLDSYHAERHPVGAAVLALTGRQFKLNTARTAHRKLLRWAAERLIAPLPPVQDRLARAYSGVSIAYPPAGPGAHPLTGTRLPRGALHSRDRSLRLAGFFHDARFVLLTRATHPGPLPAAVRPVAYTTVRAGKLPRAALVRPDGYIAWASDTPGRAETLAAVGAWVAAPGPDR